MREVDFCAAKRRRESQSGAGVPPTIIHFSLCNIHYSFAPQGATKPPRRAVSLLLTAADQSHSRPVTVSMSMPLVSRVFLIRAISVIMKLGTRSPKATIGMEALPNIIVTGT